MKYRGVGALAWAVSCLLVTSSCTTGLPWAPASLAERTTSSLDAVGADVEDALVTQAGGGLDSAHAGPVHHVPWPGWVHRPAIRHEPPQVSRRSYVG